MAAKKTPRADEIVSGPELGPVERTLGSMFRERAKRNGGRGKKTAIVALARKLLVALWRYVAQGVVIEGAVLKAKAA